MVDIGQKLLEEYKIKKRGGNSLFKVGGGSEKVNI